MALSLIPCDGTLVLTDSNGVPLVLPDDLIPYTDGDFSISGLVEVQPATTPILDKPNSR